MPDREIVGRFAPSPTGHMHAGNIFSALMSWLIVKSQGGRIVLRIEDLDVQRSKPEFADKVMRDFESLGLHWDEGPYYQQTRDEAYREAFDLISRKQAVYPCFCTRADLHAASAPHSGERLVYAGTCRSLSDWERKEKLACRQPAWRLSVPDCCYEFEDLVQGRFSQNLSQDCGDFVLKRSDGLFAYQLAVAVDDAEQGVNCIVRGVDLLSSTPQQMFLQGLLGAQSCTYAHIPLIMGNKDKRLSKRDKDASIDELQSRYGSSEAIIGHIAWLTGLQPLDEPTTPECLLKDFRIPEFADKSQVLWR